jgi:hypothetical protein
MFISLPNAFGDSQHYAEVQQATAPQVTLIRRLTEGGRVDHRNDWTYARAIQKALASANTPAAKLYQRIHTVIQNTLAALKIESQLGLLSANWMKFAPSLIVNAS